MNQATARLHSKKPPKPPGTLDPTAALAAIQNAMLQQTAAASNRALLLQNPITQAMMLRNLALPADALLKAQLASATALATPQIPFIGINAVPQIASPTMFAANPLLAQAYASQLQQQLQLASLAGIDPKALLAADPRLQLQGLAAQGCDLAIEAF